MVGASPRRRRLMYSAASCSTGLQLSSVRSMFHSVCRKCPANDFRGDADFHVKNQTPCASHFSNASFSRFSARTYRLLAAFCEISRTCAVSLLERSSEMPQHQYFAVNIVHCIQNFLNSDACFDSHCCITCRSHLAHQLGGKRRRRGHRHRPSNERNFSSRAPLFCAPREMKTMQIDQSMSDFQS